MDVELCAEKQAGVRRPSGICRIPRRRFAYAIIFEINPNGVGGTGGQGRN
jgi:hypothetical protein